MGSVLALVVLGACKEPAEEQTVTFKREAPATAAQPDALASAATGFGLDLWKRLPAGNAVMSPVSLELALAMTRSGARGETAAQMDRVLHLEGKSGVEEAATEALRTWKDELRVVNRLFGETTYTFKPEFVALTARVYGAPLERLDFQKSPEPSRSKINGWVAGETKDRIQDLIPAGAIVADTRLVLTNAIYLLAEWEDPFMDAFTTPADFFAGDKTVKAQMMSQTEHARFAQLDGMKILEKSYAGGALAMTFLLPDAPDGLPPMEASLTPELLGGWIATLADDRVQIALPRFTVEPAESIDVKQYLAEMGMPLAFQRLQADFTGIADPPSPEDRLYISNVFHKAFVKVDEKGTEAAAASAVVMAKAGGAPQAPKSVFRADHPFLFLIRDLRSGAILFVGRVVDPTAA